MYNGGGEGIKMLTHFNNSCLHRSVNEDSVKAEL